MFNINDDQHVINKILINQAETEVELWRTLRSFFQMI